MNFRKSQTLVPPSFQLAPMIDILMVVLCFFILTWNSALHENELDVKVPSAKSAKEAQPYLGQVVINIRSDGTFVMNKNELDRDALLARLKKLSGLYPDQAVIVRGDESVEYRHIAAVLDICRSADIWNVAFATAADKAAK
ncbi:MAG TPA: biopolymer transporter ExbD [Chthoniobacterales bacterium]|jgi:biopolymer transport protein ExbD